MQHLSINDLTVAECWDLLRTTSVGRVALSLNALPAIVPVQYFVEGETLAICLGQYRIPDRAVHSAVIAFAADAIEPTTRAGWSVQVQGTARLSVRPAPPIACAQQRAARMIDVEPVLMVGQRVQLCPFVSNP